VAASFIETIETFCTELLAGTDTVAGILNVALVAFASTTADKSKASVSMEAAPASDRNCWLDVLADGGAFKAFSLIKVPASVFLVAE
jgi:hypothetical protein